MEDLLRLTMSILTVMQSGTLHTKQKLCVANIRILFELVKRILRAADSINAKSFSDSRYRNINDSVQLTNALNFSSIADGTWENPTFQKQT